jgi:hypothetical protein
VVVVVRLQQQAMAAALVVEAIGALQMQEAQVLLGKVLLAVQVLAEELLAVDRAVVAELVRLVQMDLMSQ